VKRFLETKLFNLLSYSVDGKEIDRIELSMAYDDFVRQLLLFCQEEQNIILLCFAINYTVAEVKELNMRLEIENDNSSLEIRLLLAKVLSILDSTFRVVQFRLDNPDLFPINTENNFSPDVYLANDVDMIDIMELICGLFYSHSVRNKVGNTVNFSELARVFEKGMNFKFADIYKKRDDVFKRKATKLTEFLNELIIAIKIESKNRGYL
jgi:LEA14-like dessication related protein